MKDETLKSFIKWAETKPEHPTITEAKNAAPKLLKQFARPRNFTTYYYEGANNLEKDYARIGRSCARDNAIRAAVMKLLTKQFMRADIYGESGTCIGFIKRVKNKITIAVF